MRMRNTLPFLFTFLSLFFVLGSWNVKAQTGIEISSRVVADDSLNTPLANVSIVVQGTNRGTTTDVSGLFRILNVSPKALVQISMTGYISKNILAEKISLQEPIRLKAIGNNMDEVVVTGYQTLKKKNYSGAVSTVKVQDIQVASLGTLDKMLQGQVAGVAIQTTSSVFGTAPQIRVRGSASITGINEPLWVLDGVPLEAPLNITPSELYAGNARNLLASALANVNPDDINDITVLKDATATAIYGTRAVNGVIVITTKRAKMNSPISINYSFNATMTMKPSILDFDVLNSKEQIELNEDIVKVYDARMQNFSAETSGPYSKALDLYNRRLITEAGFRQMVQGLKTVNTDWFDVLFKNGVMQQHALSLSQGSEKASTRASISFLDDAGKTIGERVKRYTANFSNLYKVTNKLEIELLLKYAYRDQRNPGTLVNPFIYARDATRASKPRDDQGDYEYYKKGYANFNILEEINNNYIQLRGGDFLGQFNLNYKIRPNLKFSTLFNTRFASATIDEVKTGSSNYVNQFRANDFRILEDNPRLYKTPGSPSYLLPQTVLPEGGILDREDNSSRFLTLRAQLDWEALKKNDHNLNLFIGSELTKNKQISNFTRSYGYREESKSFAAAPLAYERLLMSTNLPIDERRIFNGRNLLQGGTGYINEFVRNTIALYSTLSYVYGGRFILDASIRNDATNVSGQATRNRFLPTWAIGGAWNLDRESFMEPVANTITNAKLRASYGLRGNAGYRGPDLVAYYQNINRNFGGYGVTGIDVIEAENDQLSFEKEYMFSTGIDLTLYKSIDLTLNYYQRKNFGLVGAKPVQSSSGYLTKFFNWADMKNQGVEVSLNIRPMRVVGDFKWSGSFNMGYNKNTVVSDYQGNSPNIFDATKVGGFPAQGKPLTGLYAFHFSRLNENGLPLYWDGNQQEVSGFLTTNKDFKNVVYQGSRDPLYSGGFNTNFNYKNVTLSGSFIFNAGHVVRKADFYRNGQLSSLFRDDLNQTKDFAYRWRAPGDEKYTQIPRLLVQEDLNDYISNGGFFDQSVFGVYNAADIRVVSASYLRVRNVTLQYNFQSLAQKLHIKNINLGLEASNLAIFASKRLNGVDPETLLTGLNMPPVRTYTFYLSATF